MKKLIKSTLTLFLLHIVLLRGSSSANTIFLGNIESVYPDGAINALKNPALVAAQKENNSLGVILNYRIYNRTDIDMNIDFLSNDKTDNDIEKQVYGGGAVGFTKKINSQGFGIGFSESDDSVYSYQEAKTIYSGTGDSSNVVSFDTEEKERKISLKGNYSYGLKIGENSYLGVKLIDRYSTSDKESETTESNTSGGGIFSNLKTSHEILTITSLEMIIGFYSAHKGDQLGFMINTGRLSFVKSDIEFHNDALIEPDGENSFSNHRQYDEGASITAGGYTRVLPFLGIALEGTFQLPAYYDEKGYDDKSFETRESSVSKNSALVFKGGLDFILTPQLSFDLGSIAFFGRSSANGGNSSYSESDFTGFNCMAGFDYHSQGGMRLMAGVLLSRYKISAKNKKDDGSSSFMIDMEAGVLNIETYIGVMYSF